MHPALKAKMEKKAEAAGRGVELFTLRPGARFVTYSELDGVTITDTGTFVSANACSAKVMLDNKKGARTFSDADGKQITIPGRRIITHWYPSVVVVPTGEVREIKTEMEAGGEEEMATLPGIGGKAKKPAVKAKTKTTAKGKEKVNSCLCGCGTKVAGRFSMGHDGKFYAMLRKVVTAELKVSELPEIARKEFGGTVNGAKSYLKEHGH